MDTKEARRIILVLSKELSSQYNTLQYEKYSGFFTPCEDYGGRFKEPFPTCTFKKTNEQTNKQQEISASALILFTAKDQRTTTARGIACLKTNWTLVVVAFSSYTRIFGIFYS